MRSPSGRFGAGHAAAIAATAAILFGAPVDVAAASARTVSGGAGASASPIPGHKPTPPARSAAQPASPAQGGMPAVPPPPNLGALPIPQAPAAPPNLPAPTPAGPTPELGPTPVPDLPPTTGAMVEPPSSKPPTGAGLPGLPGSGNEPGHAPPPDPGPGTPVAMPAGQEFRLVFEPGSDALPPADQALLTGIAARLAADQAARLQIQAYASGTDDTARQARRLSLARALAVRDYIVGQGVRSTRINVRALGADAPGEPADRVDLSLVN